MSIPLKRRGFIAGLLAVPFVYRFAKTVPPNTTPYQWITRIALRIESAQQVLPAGIDVYELNGQTLFAIIDGDHLQTGDYNLYFIDRKNNLISTATLRLWDTPKEVDMKLWKALYRFQEEGKR